MSVLDEIAAECGVHRRTVSRILSGQCKETWASMRGKAELVRKTAKRLGYRPNAAAKAISTGRFNTIALFQDTPPRSRGYLPQDLLAGIHSALGEHDMDLMLSQFPGLDAPGGPLPRALREHTVDGFLINYQSVPDYVLREIERHDIAHVWINSQLPENAVYPDDRTGTRMLTEHLIAMGHRRIGYLDPGFDFVVAERRHFSRDARFHGFLDAMRDAGLAPHRLMLSAPPETMSHTEVASAYRPWLGGNERVTAVVCYHRSVALSLMYMASDRYGLRVPDDLSVVATGELQASHQEIDVTAALLHWD